MMSESSDRHADEAAGAPEATEALVGDGLSAVEIGSGDEVEFVGDNSREWTRAGEDALIACVRDVLALHGLAYSGAAVRDLADGDLDAFGPSAAVAALSAAGFEAGLGEHSGDAIVEGLCPMICFGRDGSVFVVRELSEGGGLVVAVPRDGTMETNEISPDDIVDLGIETAVIARKRDVEHAVTRPTDWFWQAMRQSKSTYAQVILAALTSNFLGLSTSLFIMVVYDRVVPNQAVESLLALTIGVVIAVVFDFVIKMLKAQFIDRASQKADARMARLIFDRILALPLDNRRQNSGAMATVVREFDTLREFFTSATLVAIVDLPFIFLFIWVIHLIAGPLALIPLIAVPLVIVSGLAIQPLLSRISESAMKSGMTKQGVLVETLSGIETIQATGSGPLMRRRFEQASGTQSELGLKNRALSQFAVNSTATILQFAQVGTIFYGVFLIMDGSITMGAMIAAVILGGRALSPMAQLSAALARANSARSAFRSLSAIMNSGEPAALEAPRPRLSRPHLRGEIELKDLTYQIPGASAPIISGLSVKIAAGQRVAILGRMGSGKSTFARLAAGLVAPGSGSVLIDGVDMRQVDKSDLNRNVGVMLQESWLFSGSVKQNIQMGFHEYGDEHLLDICKTSGVDDFVGQHPEGYDMMLRERGEGLSGGQRQSINLARALLHNPSTLILDEPTSSMDTATEAGVLKRLGEWGQGKTMVIVTHRNSVLDICDRVLVFDRGNIIADTTPSQLRSK